MHAGLRRCARAPARVRAPVASHAPGQAEGTLRQDAVGCHTLQGAAGSQQGLARGDTAGGLRTDSRAAAQAHVSLHRRDTPPPPPASPPATGAAACGPVASSCPGQLLSLQLTMVMVGAYCTPQHPQGPWQTLCPLQLPSARAVPRCPLDAAELMVKSCRDSVSLWGPGAAAVGCRDTWMAALGSRSCPLQSGMSLGGDSHHGHWPRG